MLLEHFLFPSNNRKCPRSWGVDSCLVPAAPSTLPPSFSPFSLPSSLPFHLLGALAECASVGARVPLYSQPLGRAAAVRVRVPVRRRAPVRGPQRTHPRREREGPPVRGRGPKRKLAEKSVRREDSFDREIKPSGEGIQS